MQAEWKSILAHSGAVFDEEDPPHAPAARHFGDPRAECEAGRRSAVVFDVNDRTQVELTGGDRIAFLNNFCTNDLTKLLPGAGCETFLCNVKGRVLAHAFAFVEDASVWLETVAGTEEALVAHLDRYLITEDVALHRRSDQWGELFVTGPNALPALRSAGMPCELPQVGAHALQERGPSLLRVRRVDWFDRPGVLVSAPRERLPDVWNGLAAVAVPPGGALAFHALRIAAGFPLYGTDITEDNLAQEAARTRRAISFTKGCYLGQEPIARIDAMGHVNRELRGLRLETGPAPRPGAAIVAPEDGQEIGRITSAVQLEDDPPLALGYVRSRFVEPGTAVLVEAGTERRPATVFRTLPA